MRPAPVVVVAALATVALATPAPPPATTWADWVGEWEGKLKWKGCISDGVAAALLPIEASDGAVELDLGAARGGLGPVSLVEDNAGWAGQRGDVTVHVARGKADALELAVDFDSGCQLRATLKRPTVGIAACDRLAAWARIEARCSKLSRPPLEDAARLAHQRATWADARGQARGKLATQCDARAAKVASELVDAGCAPNPDPQIGLRGAECHALQTTAARLARCTNVPHDLRSVLAQMANDLVAAAQTAEGPSLAHIETECRNVREQLVTASQQAGCPP
jgi:hypothetical protein